MLWAALPLLLPVAAAPLAQEAPTRLAVAAPPVICAVRAPLQGGWAALPVRRVLWAALPLLLVAAAAWHVPGAPLPLETAALPAVCVRLALALSRRARAHAPHVYQESPFRARADSAPCAPSAPRGSMSLWHATPQQTQCVLRAQCALLASTACRVALALPTQPVRGALAVLWSCFPVAPPMMLCALLCDALLCVLALNNADLPAFIAAAMQHVRN